MWKEYNPNPTGRRTGDCAVRAVTKALDIDWETAYAKLAMSGFAMGDMPNENSVVAATLRKAGFYRSAIPNTCPDCYTAEEVGTQDAIVKGAMQTVDIPTIIWQTNCAT